MAVVTIASSRPDHLRGQQAGLAAGHRVPDVYVVVGIGTDEPAGVTRSGPLPGTGCRILDLRVEIDTGLPLAAARNAGAAAALADGAEVLIFLDVDCVPAPDTVADYLAAVTATPGPALHCGPVRYLADGESAVPVGDTLPGSPHPARPAPAPGQVVSDTRWPLFWSLSFAVAAADWHRLGGFDEAYVGYGGEDTDLAYRAFRSGFAFCWRGGPPVFHQFHPTQRPPVDHLTAIVANAARFRDRWGFPIMEGWLRAFADLGLVTHDAAAERWSLTPAARTMAAGGPARPDRGR